jgi:hypothetical protein
MQHSDKKHIILKYPTRHRPIKFMNNLNAYLDKASGKHKITVVITMDIDDSSMNNNPLRYYMTNKIKNGFDVAFSYGNSEGKIAAINRGVPTTDWDIIISTADDMEPVVQGWDDIIVQDMMREFPDLDGALNYNNDPRLEAKGAEGFKTLITLPVIGRKLYDRFGYIYHPSYKSEWCDNEQTEVFEKLGVLRHINSRPIIHKWAENQDALMQRNMQIGVSVDRDNYAKRKALGFDGLIPIEPSTNNMIVQITRTRDELFLIKEMLPIWQKYADGFVFLVDTCTDGTYEFLKENSQKYNILSILQINRDEEKLAIESDARQMLFDEAFKFSGKILCLDSDEYFDGNVTKAQLNEVLENNKDTLFYTQWIQYIGKNEIRTDGKWANHPVDRIGSYSKRTLFKTKQMHSEHLPVPDKQMSIAVPHLFVSHLQWIDKKAVAIKQYYWKIEDYVNRARFNADTIDYREYDSSVQNLKWNPVPFPFPLKARTDIYQMQDLMQNYKYRFIKDSIEKYNIPNLNDWGMGIH